jgi:hypothetical protein
MYIILKYKALRLLAPSGPPLNIRITARSTSSLSFDWDLPETSKQNGVIISYTACVSHSENGPCFQIFITNERKWLVGDLNPSTKYYVRVLASTKVGHGKYSESEGYFTLGSEYNMYISTYSPLNTLILDYGCAVWHTRLPSFLVEKIERIQKRIIRVVFFRIIFPTSILP